MNIKGTFNANGASGTGVSGSIEPLAEPRPRHLDDDEGESVADEELLLSEFSTSASETPGVSSFEPLRGERGERATSPDTAHPVADRPHSTPPPLPKQGNNSHKSSSPPPPEPTRVDGEEQSSGSAQHWGGRHQVVPNRYERSPFEVGDEPTREWQREDVSFPTRATRRIEGIRERDLLLGRYRVTRVFRDGIITTANAVRLGLGSGAQIQVLESVQEDLTEAREYFAQTGRALVQLRSDHIARVIEIGEFASGAPFVVTERSGHSDLAEVLGRRGALAVGDAVDYVLQVAEGLAEAHSQGVMHGGLRPSCVHITEGADGAPLLRLGGFGAPAQWMLLGASLSGSRDPSSDMGSGSAAHMAPEQFRISEDVDDRCDIWALGTLLYEMLLGVPAFRGGSLAELLASIAADQPASICATRGDVPRALESVILRCLEKRPSARYPSVAELVRALQPFSSIESHSLIDRVVRITARGHRNSSTAAPPQAALVHVPNATAFSTPPSSHETTASPPRLGGWHFGALLAAFIFLGGAAGICGALVVLGRSSNQEASSIAPPLPASVNHPQVTPPAERPPEREPPSATLPSVTSVLANQAASCAPVSSLAISQPPNAVKPPETPRPRNMPEPLARVQKANIGSQASRVSKLSEVATPARAVAARAQLFDDIN